MSERLRYIALFLTMLIFSFLVPDVVLAQDVTGSVSTTACPVEVPNDLDIECGTLTLPENHSDPVGKQIALPYIIIHSADPTAVPLLFTEGGPGYTAMYDAWFLRDLGFWKDRDVIIVEQRGNLFAEPSLYCDVSVWWEESEDNLACLNSLRSQGINVSHYTMQQSVEDIETLRLSLGIDEWNLFGTSYSTRLFLLYMQTYPDDIRCVILDSVSPPDVTRYNHDPETALRVLDTMFRNCEEDKACSQAYPDLEERFYMLVKQLNEDPVMFTITHDLRGNLLSEPFDQEVTGHILIDWMVSDAFYGHGYGENKTPYLPLLIDLVSEGKTEYLYPWLVDDVLNALKSDQRFAYGYYFAVNCQNDLPLWNSVSGLAGSELLDGYLRYQREKEICDAWSLTPQPVTYEELDTDIPTLVLAGAYDPVTPPEWGKQTAAMLGYAHSLEFPAEGHGVMGKSTCAQSISREFLMNPQNPLDTSCMTSLPEPEFITPADVVLAPGLYYSVWDIDYGTSRGRSVLETISMVCLLAYCATILGGIIVGARWLVRRNTRNASVGTTGILPYALLLTISIVGMAIPVVTTQVNRVMWNYPIMWFFGLLPGHPMVILLGILSLLFAILHLILIVCTSLAWAKRSHSLFVRILLSIVSLLSFSVTYLVIKWDLVTILFS